jgi:hypothetical protein
LFLLGLAIGIGGYFNQYCGATLSPGFDRFVGDFYANVTVDLISIAFAVLVIDGLNERRAQQQLLAQLIRNMGHPTDSGITHQGVRELRAHGWLTDGSLAKAVLFCASLRPAWLQGAYLPGAYLRDANLQGAYLRDANLQGAYLQGARLKWALAVGAKLQGADLWGADRQGARLWEASHLTQKQVHAAYGDEHTKLPSGLTPPAHWRDSTRSTT